MSKCLYFVWVLISIDIYVEKHAMFQKWTTWKLCKLVRSLVRAHNHSQFMKLQETSNFEVWTHDWLVLQILSCNTWMNAFYIWHVDHVACNKMCHLTWSASLGVSYSDPCKVMYTWFVYVNRMLSLLSVPLCSPTYNFEKMVNSHGPCLLLLLCM